MIDAAYYFGEKSFCAVFKGKRINASVVYGELGENMQDSVFRDNKTERMRTMKTYEGIMSIGNMDLKSLVIEESHDSLIVTAKKKAYVPEMKIILMNQATEQETRFLMGVNENKGGLIV